MTVGIQPHPYLDAVAFVSRFGARLGDTPSPEFLRALLSIDAAAPLTRSEEVRGAVRDMLRHGGYKPTGRGKPASEYLVRAAGDGSLSSINAAVDVCNVVSLHSGLPISLIDLDRATPPLHIAIAPVNSSYVFNASGQEIALDGLLCLFDADGPCANAVKDSQRTKTNDDTTSTLTVIWGVAAHSELTGLAHRWYLELLERMGVEVESAEARV